MTKTYFPCGPFEPFEPKKYPGIWIDKNGTVLVPGPRGPLVPALHKDIKHLDIGEELKLYEMSVRRGGTGVYGPRRGSPQDIPSDLSL